jgi:hypothetical protein
MLEMKKYPLIESLGLMAYNEAPSTWVYADDLECVLEKAVAVRGLKASNGWAFSEYRCGIDTHTALLICIQPIAKPDTFEQLAKDVADLGETITNEWIFKMRERAKRLLEGK